MSLGSRVVYQSAPALLLLLLLLLSSSSSQTRLRLSEQRCFCNLQDVPEHVRAFPVICRCPITAVISQMKPCNSRLVKRNAASRSAVGAVIIGPDR